VEALCAHPGNIPPQHYLATYNCDARLSCVKEKVTTIKGISTKAMLCRSVSSDVSHLCGAALQARLASATGFMSQLQATGS
jgi:hypothetical protein